MLGTAAIYFGAAELKRQDSEAIVSVKDNGIGIPAHMLPNVLDLAMRPGIDDDNMVDRIPFQSGIVNVRRNGLRAVIICCITQFDAVKGKSARQYVGIAECDLNLFPVRRSLKYETIEW